MRVAILADFPLHVIPELGDDFRTPGHYATWLPQLSSAYGEFSALDAHWLILTHRVSVPRKVRWNNQTFHLIPTTQRFRAATLFVSDRNAIRACLAEIQPALVHGWGTEDVYALAATTSGYPNILSMQGILSHLALKGRMHPRVYLQALIELFALHKANHVTVESEWGRKLLLRRNSRAHIHLVEYGVQNHFLDVPWQPNPTKPAAIFIGSITPNKGIQDAVAAFRDPALAHAELWVVGGGESNWVSRLRADAPKNVKWFGRLSPSATADQLSRAWCLVLPTRADTCPNVVKEARVIGLPVISTPCGGQTTYIQQNENGFLTEPGDIKTLTNALAEILSNFDRCKTMGHVHHKEHRHTLSPMRTAEGFFALYQQIVKS